MRDQGDDTPELPEHPDARLDPNWIPDKAFEAQEMDRQLEPAMSNAELARKIFRENAPMAAQRIVHIALHDGNSNTALRASAYITERVLGRIGEDVVAEDPLAAMYEMIENEANKTSGAYASTNTNTNNGNQEGEDN